MELFFLQLQFDPVILLVLGIAGLIAGLYGSVVGGGSLIVVPALLLTGLPLPQILATNRTSALALESASLFSFARKGKVNWKIGLIFGVPALVGGLLGANIVVAVDENILSYSIAFFMLIMLGFMFLHDKLGLEKKTTSTSPIVLGLIGLGIGIYGGFFGAAAGTMSLLAFTILAGSDYIEAAANSRVVGTFFSVSSTIFFIISGFVIWELVVPLVIGMVIGAHIGTKTAIAKGNPYIKKLLAFVIIITAIKLVLFP